MWGAHTINAHVICMVYKLIEFLTKFKLTNEQSQCVMIMVTNNLDKDGLQAMIDYFEAVKRDMK